MKRLALALGLASMVAALRAAWLCREATRVPITPAWSSVGPDGGPFEPVDPVQSLQGWTVGRFTADAKTATLNKSGALWAASSAVLSGLAAVAGVAAT